MRPSTKLKTLCFDIDGTLYMDNRLLPQALETVKALSEEFNIAYVTNTTSLSIDTITRELVDFGFPVTQGCVFNPAAVAEAFLVEKGLASGILLAERDAEKDYTWFRQVPADHKDCKSVIVGTEGYNLTFMDLSEPLKALLNGAELFALQKNRFYKKAGRFLLDLGPLTAALEYASSKSATLFGKPSETLFRTVSEKYGHGLEELGMIGDDIEFDVFGAMDLGITAFLIKTGKYDPKYASSFTRKPDHELDILSELRDIL